MNGHQQPTQSKHTHTQDYLNNVKNKPTNKIPCDSHSESKNAVAAAIKYHADAKINTCALFPFVLFPTFCLSAINWTNINSMRCIVNASNANNSQWKCDFLVSSHFSLYVCMGMSSSVHSNHSGNDRCVSHLARHTEHKIFIELCNANMLNLQTHSLFSFFSLFVSCRSLDACSICLNLSFDRSGQQML